MSDEETLEKLRPLLEKEGYKELKVIEGRGICGICPFAFTVAIVYGIDRTGYEGRYCYAHENAHDLVVAFLIWDGKSDPIGRWIKHKGRTEYSNPNYIQ